MGRKGRGGMGGTTNLETGAFWAGDVQRVTVWMNGWLLFLGCCCCLVWLFCWLFVEVYMLVLPLFLEWMGV
jgi:hypothetical protein